jgi:hypothetical protein
VTGAAREALISLRALADDLPARATLPKEAARPTRRMLGKLELLAEAMLRAPSVSRVEEALGAVRAAVGQADGFTALSARTLRYAATAMWQRGGAASDIPGLLEFALAAAERDAALLHRLADSWLREAGHHPTAARAGAAISRALRQSTQLSLSRWRLAEERHGLFLLDRGPQSLARAVLNGSGPAALAECLLDRPSRAEGAYLRHLCEAVAREAGLRLVKPDAPTTLQRATGFLAPAGKLRFAAEPDVTGRVADALVEPFVRDAASQPVEDIRRELLRFLRTHLGDPRVEPERWRGASGATVETVRRWLTSLTLDAFFRTIGRFAEKAGYDATWEKREAFWRACLRKKYIREAWVVVGPKVKAGIGRNPELAGGFGEIEDPPDPNQSVLLMQIGNHVFAEWSHNGSLRVYEAAAASAPRLFHRSYKLASLRRDSLAFPAPRLRQELGETSAQGLRHNAVWRERVAEFLRRRQNRNIEEHEWQTEP